MKSPFNTLGVAVCGLATSVLIALANASLAHYSGFNLFSLSIWVVVPLGAIIMGAVAASGYYAGAIYFQSPPGKALMLQMVVIAGFTQLLIYWLGYMTAVLDDGTRLSDLAPFSQYLDFTLTKGHYRATKAMFDLGEVGKFGYFLALLQFFGFLLGGVFVGIHLQAKPMCSKCKLYLRPLAKKEKRFDNAQAAGLYYNELFTFPIDGPDFANLIRSEAKIDSVSTGAMKVTTCLMGCPKCNRQQINESVKRALHKLEWENQADLARSVAVPVGIDLAPVFRN